MMTFMAPCAIGAEKVLANELKQLGFVPESSASGKATVGRVYFSPTAEDAKLGDAGWLAAAYRANLCLRTADRVYAVLGRFPCTDFDALFVAVKAIRWQDWFRKDVRVVVDKVRTHASKLSSEHSIQGVVHKAIYTELGEVWRMSVLPETGDEATVRVYIERDEASILLDLSGMPLHRRGYRTAGGEAPIRETLASILLQLMNWRRKTPLHDAFCGSGTIPIEAVLYAHDIAPGLGRSFALESLVPFTGDSARAMIADERRKAAMAIRTDCLVRVTGSDIDANVLVSAQANAERACAIAGKALQSVGRDERIQRPDFVRASFDELAAPYDTGLLLSNPPYGERLGDSDSARALYSSMHRIFTDFPGWEYGFITSHEEFEEAIGRRATKKRALKSGNLDTSFYMYTREK
jgi:putative N6-adenine-specific DNA methylase